MKRTTRRDVNWDGLYCPTPVSSPDALSNTPVGEQYIVILPAAIDGMPSQRVATNGTKDATLTMAHLPGTPSAHTVGATNCNLSRKFEINSSVLRGRLYVDNECCGRPSANRVGWQFGRLS